MSDSETLRAAAAIVKRWHPGWSGTHGTLVKLADELKAVDLDQHLSEVASDAWHESGANFLAVARAVREAIEAEQ